MAGAGFDRDKWKSVHGQLEVKDNPRGAMVVQVDRDVIHLGMPREDVIQELGLPDFTRGSADFYELGRSEYGIDYEYYVIRYQDGKVSSKQVERG